MRVVGGGKTCMWCKTQHIFRKVVPESWARFWPGPEKAAQHIWGIGFHWYGDPTYEVWPDWSHEKFKQDCSNVQKVHEGWPSKHIVFTEGCQEKGARIGDWALGERYGMEIIDHLSMTYSGSQHTLVTST